jgi:hypothetical protein
VDEIELRTVVGGVFVVNLFLTSGFVRRHNDVEIAEARVWI